ncbi:MAG: alpha/beta fold hydrolase [Anaerolineales bacterium]|nr:alpha/beta fold hydrolase [Anaerolineales bacterium]
MQAKTFREQGQEFQAHRQFYRMRFKANDMDFAFQLLMGTAVHGGVGIGESFYAASRIKDGDPDSWEREWTALGERVRKRGEAALRAGHVVSGREALLRAAVYYRAALASMRPSDPEFRPTVATMRKSFQTGCALLEPALERIEVPFEGAVLPGYFQKAAADNTPRRTLLMIGGGETFTEDLYYFIAPAAIKRGYNFMTVDLPGQGDLPFQGMYFRSDFETPMKFVVDYALSRPDVDHERLAAYGISAGGYMVPRAATRERRIRACVANSMIFNMHTIFLDSPIPKIKGLVRRLAEWRAPFQIRMLELIAWRWGLDGRDFGSLVEKNRDVVFDPAGIACPTLILIGEGEHQNPEIRRQQQHALQVLPDSRKKLIVGPLDEGAGHHVMGENVGLMSALVFDWLDEVFEG